MERAYKIIRNAGAGCIAIRVTMVVTRLTVGIISIVDSALLLKRKPEIKFQWARLPMTRNTTKCQKLGWVLFMLYLCPLACSMFFSESFGRTDTNRDYQHNLVPFKEISRYSRYYNTIGPLLFLINMVGNMAAFLPFDFFLLIISRRSKEWYNTVMLGFGFSLTLEILQLISRVGSFNVDDMQLNTLGVVLGYMIHRFVQYTRVRIRYRRLTE